MSRFGNIELGAPIEPFALSNAFTLDSYSNKVNLGAGVYRTEGGHPWVLPCVKKAEELMSQDDTLDHEYLPVLGYTPFCKAATALLLGNSCQAILEGRALGVQSLSGTGCLRLAAEFLSRILKYNTVYISSPSWENHKLVFKLAGFKHIREYRYWDSNTRGLDLEGLLEDLRNAPENSVVILHSCAHNPTGCDPTQEQWKAIAEVMEQNKLFPLFDSAYQGFATGDVDADAWAVRYFTDKGFELLCAQSFAKNFGLYNERVGNLTFVVKCADVLPSLKSQVTIIIRGMYSNPPAHGAKIVAMVLHSTSLQTEWKNCIQKMSDRIREMRDQLRIRLESLSTPGSWEHITTQIGMFCYTGLTVRQVEHLVEKYHIYMFRSGRINMCGLNMDNLDYVSKAIHDTIISIPGDAKYY